MWIIESGDLVAAEPAAQEIAARAEAMSAIYNESRELMANEGEMSPEDVVEWYADLRAEGGRPFFLYIRGELAGDADLRALDLKIGEGEFAIVLGGAAKGQGFGTRFASMVHAFAFHQLGLERLRVSIVPANKPSLRLFEKLGYLPDDSPAARALVDDESDLTLSLERSRFDALFPAAKAGLTLHDRA
jgi:RimJ/RimL family protein N-acetyltransferase